MVRVGDCDQDVEDIDEQEFSIKAVHFHPENNVGAYHNNDLAVVRLSSRVSHLLPFPRPGVHHLELGQHGPGQWRLLQAARVPILETRRCMERQVYEVRPRQTHSGNFRCRLSGRGVVVVVCDGGGGG